tara:strand:- start:873 stop:1790 length:918 start_codon:yes stop_codon:yes gene_type:complete
MKISIYSGSFDSEIGFLDRINYFKNLEDKGFKSLWIANANSYDALNLALYLSTQTSSIELGTAVIPVFPKHPVELAQQILTTAMISNNRLKIGLGVSHKHRVENELGLRYVTPVLYMKEFLIILKDILHKGYSKYKGSLFNIDVSIDAETSNDVDIYLAALGPKMLGLAREYTEGTITWMTGYKTIKNNIFPALNSKTDNTKCILSSIPICITDDVEAVTNEAKSIFKFYNNYPNYKKMIIQEGVKDPSDLAIVGDEDYAYNVLQEYANSGVTEILAVVFGEDINKRINIQSRTLDFLLSIKDKF